MIRRRTLVVSRQLLDCRPFASAVLELPKDNKAGLEKRLKEMAIKHILAVKKLMPELQQATWYLDYIETADDPTAPAVYWEPSEIIKPLVHNLHRC